MDIKKLLLKQMAILSAILGLVLGILTIIPFIGQFAFFTLFVLTAPIVIIYMKKMEMLGLPDIRQGSIYGAIIGFVAFIAFSLSFMPLAAIIALINKSSQFLWVMLLIKAGFFVPVMLIFFVALLCALINAFSGLVTIYIHNQITQKPVDTTEINIEE